MTDDFDSMPKRAKRVLVLRDPLFERQHRESSAAWQAFVLYRDDESGRSIRKVGQELGKSEALISRWSSHWKWTVRVQAYEAEKDRERLALAKKSRIDAIERQLKLASDLLTIVGAHVKDKLERIAAGELPLSALEIVRWLEIGVKIERLALGEPTEHTMTDTPEMAQERRLRDAVATVRDSMREDPALQQELVIEWAVQEFNVDLARLLEAVSVQVDARSKANN